MSHNTFQIAPIVQGILLQEGNADIIQHLLLDSRKISQPKNALFIAIKGARHDGHRFIEEIYKAGVRNFIVEKEIDLALVPGASVIKVNSAVIALQTLAADHRSNFTIPVIGITGSNGKTIVKEWLNVLLADDYNIVRSPKSYNSQVGVPISVWNMEASHTLGIFEAGISQPGEMGQLAKVIQPTIGIFTSIGTAHSENFLSRRQLIGEKLTLFANASIIICPDDADLLQLILPWSSTKQLVLMSRNEKATANTHSNSSTVKIEWNGATHEFDIPFIDRASVENVLTCIHCLLVLNYEATEIQNRLARLAPLEMRLQLLDGEGESVIVNDAYSNDLQSLEIALDFLNQHARGRIKTVILSDILQSGRKDEDLHERISSLLAAKGIESFYGVGKSMIKNAGLYPEGSQFFESTEDFLLKKNAGDYARSAVLVKGARDLRFERIVNMLQEKTHDTILEIDLGALGYNLNYFRSRLKPGTKVMVMVKAFGYGSGAHEVASLLEFNKVDYLAVAYTDEGVALRKAGVSLPIMVMNPEQSSLPALIRHKLEPEIYNMRTLESVLKAIDNAGITAAYPVHIKLDTGMHRLGFGPAEITSLTEKMRALPQLRIASVFTHLAATDDAQHDGFTSSQLSAFDNGCRVIENNLQQPFLRHALNTGGIQRFPDAQYDMVRLGIGLYGVAAYAEEQSQLHPVSTLKTVISQLKNITKGESVGYSRKFVAKGDMRIATIPLGYADGLRRSLSNGKGHVLINGQKAAIVGNVCMDMTMVDVTTIDCSEGDAVEIFGSRLTLREFAHMSDTIEYEILTSVSQRVKRVYLQE